MIANNINGMNREDALPGRRVLQSCLAGLMEINQRMMDDDDEELEVYSNFIDNAIEEEEEDAEEPVEDEDAMDVVQAEDAMDIESIAPMEEEYFIQVEGELDRNVTVRKRRRQVSNDLSEVSNNLSVDFEREEALIRAFDMMYLQG